MIPVTLGNLVGGVIFDGLGFWFLYFYLRRWEMKHNTGDLTKSKAEKVISAEEHNEDVPEFIRPKQEEEPKNENPQNAERQESNQVIIH